MILEIIIVVIIGVLAGAVVNVLADDLPLRRPVRLPRYVSDEKKRSIHLPLPEDDSEPLAWRDDERRPVIAWSGIAAFLFGKRTSSDSSVKLSWRYPLAELLTVFLMVITIPAIEAINNNPETVTKVDFIQTVFWLIYMAIFALIVVIDVEHKLILFVVIIPSAALAVLDALLTVYQPTVVNSLIGGVAGFAIFFMVYNGGFLFTYVMGRLRGKKIDEVAFGYGDVMMATVSGLILGWQAFLFSMFITVFLGAFGALIYLFVKIFVGGKYTLFAAIPYGPYIVAGTIIMLLYRVQAIDYLLAQ